MHQNGLGREVLITGGAGFIGSNLAARLLQSSQANVRIFDNLSRPNVETNLAWLRSLPGASRRLQVCMGDVRDSSAVAKAVAGCTEIYHLAAQVAVTTSIANPVEDFQVNALGTLNVLEAMRSQPTPPFLLFTSTNKVYGSLESLRVRKQKTRYVASDPEFNGVDENACLDFHSPYGCSKGAADQYVRDHARIYNLPTVVFRMSCICGPRQFGTEDQGWVAHFVYSAIAGKPITIYGNGCQVRDILHVDDLLDAMESVRANLPQCRGRVFNLGGGPGRAASVHEILLSVEKLLGKHIRISYAEVRPGDQPLYISNTDGLRRLTGWEPRRTIDQMLRDIREFAGSLAHDAGDHADKRQTLPAEGMVA